MPSSPHSSDAAEPGTCFGFAVRSSLPFHYLRGGTGQPLEVSSPSRPRHDPAESPRLEWTPTPRRPFRARLFGDEQRYELWIEGAGWFVVEPQARRIEVPEDGDAARREQRLWGIPALLCMRAREDLPLHSAAVEVDGGAIVFAAPGSFGKTTLAAAFHCAGHRLLNEDLTCIRLSDAPAVVPGPALLRLRPDVASSLEVHDSVVVSTGGGREHRALTRPRGDCEPVPLRAIVLLLPSSDGVRMEPSPLAETVRDLWALAFRLPSDADAARSLDQLAGLAASVPVHRLWRPLTFDSLPETVDRIVRDA